MAEDLLRDNLNGSKPLPHGIHSGYYRFCQHNGLLVHVGIPPRFGLTLIHAAQEIRDQEWPIPGFWRERPCIVRTAGNDQSYVVRESRPEYGMFCLCLGKVIRDLLGEGILHEGMVGSVRVNWARSGEVFDYFMARSRTSSYPYFCPWVVRTKR
jgi:aminoglycoside 3-N-acetyltransferase